MQKLERQYLWSGAAFLLGAALAALIFSQDGTLLAQPLAAFGQWLRGMSLSGAGGNLLAWGIVLALSALPLLGFRCAARRAADLLLPLAAIELFAAQYFLVNPSLILPAALKLNQYAAANVWGFTALGCIAATILCWLMLRTLRQLDEKPANLLPQLLFWAAVLYAFVLGFSAVQAVIGDMNSVSTGNTDENRVFTSYALLFSLAIIELLPSMLAVYAMLLGGKLAFALDAEPFVESTLTLAETISKGCMRIAKLSLLLTALGNALQLLFFSKAAMLHMQIKLPLITLLLCAVLIVLCKYFRRAKTVSDDNATII